MARYEHAVKPRRALRPSMARGFLRMADGGSVVDLLANRGNRINSIVDDAQGAAPAPPIATTPVAPTPAPITQVAPIGDANTSAWLKSQGMGPDGKMLPKPSIFQRLGSAVGLKDGGPIDGQGTQPAIGPVVGEDRSRGDKVPILGEDGEYMIPRDVVKAVGTAKLDRMVAKHHKPSGYGAPMPEDGMAGGAAMMADGGPTPEETFMQNRAKPIPPFSFASPYSGGANQARRNAISDFYAAGSKAGGPAAGAGLAARGAVGAMVDAATDVPGAVSDVVASNPQVQSIATGAGNIARFAKTFVTGNPSPAVDQPTAAVTPAPAIAPQRSTAPPPVASTVTPAANTGLPSTADVLSPGTAVPAAGTGAMVTSDGRKVTFGNLATSDQTDNFPAGASTAPIAAAAPGRISNYRYAAEPPNPRDIPLDMSALNAAPVNHFAEYQRLRNDGTFSGMGAAKAYLKNVSDEAAAQTAAVNAQTGRIGTLAQANNYQAQNAIAQARNATEAARTNIEGANVGSQMQERSATTQGKIADLAKQKRIDDLREQYLKETDPIKKRVLENQLYVLGGKPMQKLQIVESQQVDPNTMAITKTPYIVNQDTGETRPAIPKPSLQQNPQAMAIVNDAKMSRDDKMKKLQAMGYQ